MVKHIIVEKDVYFDLVLLGCSMHNKLDEILYHLSEDECHTVQGIMDQFRAVLTRVKESDVEDVD